MLAHYSHVRIDAKRKALDALSGGVTKGVTSQSTSQNSGVPLQVIDKNGGADETRTRDLLRDRQLKGNCDQLRYCTIHRYSCGFQRGCEA
jgi:hypothetical protein